MRRPYGSPDAAVLAALFVLSFGVGGCRRPPEGPPLFQPGAEGLAARLLDPSVSSDARIERILAEGRAGNRSAVPALIRTMKDRSQVAFLLEADPKHPLGYRAVELKETGPDERPLERVAAICALEAVGGHLALLDLLLALDDRNPVVSNHAARALVRLGNRAGLEALLVHLEGRTFPAGDEIRSPVFAGETAHRILKEITGAEVAYNADGGLAAKMAGAARWRQWLAEQEKSGRPLALEGQPYQEGADGETDRRIRFHVDMLGQMQFLYHEQARKALIRMGVPALSFLRWGVDQQRKSPNATGLAGIAQVLGGIRHPNSRLLLEEVLRDGPGAARARAVEALGAQGGPEALPALAGALGDRDEAVRLAAIGGLGTIGGEEAAGLLRTLDPGSDPGLREARTLALFSASGGQEQREEVLSLLRAESIASRNAAHAVLLRLTKQTAGYSPLGSDAERTAAIEEYRRVLKAR